MRTLRLSFLVACIGGMLLPGRVQAQENHDRRNWQVRSGLTLTATNQDFFDHDQQAFLQYEFGVAFNVGTRWSLAPSMIYLRGLATADVFNEGMRGQNGSVTRHGGWQIGVSQNEALALGLQARRYLGTGAFRPFLGLQGYLMSNSLSHDGYLLGARAGGDYALGTRWTLGVEAQWNSRLIAREDAWQMVGVGASISYFLK